MALGIDYGRVYVFKRQLQGIADSAVLAGASMIRLEYTNPDFNSGTSGNDGKKVVFTTREKITAEAKKAFDENKKNQIADSSITVSEPEFTIDEQTASIKCNISGEIRIYTVAVFLGLGNSQKVSVVAEARAADDFTQSN